MGRGWLIRPARRLFLIVFSHFFGREMSQPLALVELAPSTSASCNHWPRAPIIRGTKVDGATGSSSIPGAIPAAVGPWLILSGCTQAKSAVVRLMAAVRIRRQTRSPWGFCPWNKGLLGSGSQVARRYVRHSILSFSAQHCQPSQAFMASCLSHQAWILAKTDQRIDSGRPLRVSFPRPMRRTKDFPRSPSVWAKAKSVSPARVIKSCCCLLELEHCVPWPLEPQGPPGM
ncbi:uncharacterized protein BO80DRAFT_128765 [Aspergillus ibericus CBS 121593]|uniref:Secreted protein n=1 Tax=Aspergillus ibericus CBS 121593 TaxID=1448316 RepID=A0A395GUZ0_9EURO|nr:hypothetical protein BO80DRAFT_128765 [Aspergillus ibericus CBS 121593]RAK99370.1 hypothetical protein BO80DRAFT_128765 [Aspergillus ibericus CBS 121593]